MQAKLNKRESQIADLQENLKSQQAETSKAKEELTSALSVMEKLKEGFNKERADWATEKAALTKKVETAEAALKPVVEELTGLKRQIDAMTSAVFGNKPLHNPLAWNVHKSAGLLLLCIMQDLASLILARICGRN